jgi:hypothetical protein
MATNWDMIRISYELLGEDIPTIAMENKIAPAALEYTIEERGWTRQGDAFKTTELTKLDSPDDLAEASEELLEQVKARLDLAMILKQQHLAPTYLKLELALLHKATEIAQHLNSQAHNAASQLKALSETWKNLLEQNDLVKCSVPEGKERGDGKLVVQIMNQMKVSDDGPQTSESRRLATDTGTDREIEIVAETKGPIPDIRRTME